MKIKAFALGLVVWAALRWEHLLLSQSPLVAALWAGLALRGVQGPG